MNDEAGGKPKEGSLEYIATQAAVAEKADIYLYNGAIVDEGYLGSIDAVSGDRDVQRCILLITTFGGSAEAAYRIARWFQRYYTDFVVFPTSVCASAGTLITIGATRLIMSPFSELGPLDVQLAKRNELGQRKSGLVTKAALENLQEKAFDFWEYFMLQIRGGGGGNISFEMCAKIATEVCSTVFSEMYKQVDSDVLGQDDRNLKIASEYGLRLAKKGKNISSAAIEKLVQDYPSHEFVIDADEAAELFKVVDYPSEKLTELILKLGSDALQTEFGMPTVKRLASAPKPNQPKRRKTGDEPPATE